MNLVFGLFKLDHKVYYYYAILIYMSIFG